MKKIDFLNKAIQEKRNIAAFHLNDVFLEFADIFYFRKNNALAMASFKKYLKIAANENNVSIAVNKTDYVDRIDFGVRYIWTIVYE